MKIFAKQILNNKNKINKKNNISNLNKLKYYLNF